MLAGITYLDHAATTPVDPAVMELMGPYFSDRFGNPSSVHRVGQQAETALEHSRLMMAEILGCKASEIVFTGCGSESDNLALRGAALAAQRARGAEHILVSPVEHDAILETARALADHHGFEVEELPVDAYGRVSPDKLKRRLREDTAVASIIYANNEIGTINPIPELAAVCRAKGVPFHTDAVQAASQLPLDIKRLGVDLLSLGAHKFYGPKGIGALFVRSDVDLVPSLTGGSHEQGRRAGTPNVPLIVGMAHALQITVRRREEDNDRYRTLRNLVIEGVLSGVSEAQLTGHPDTRLPNHASFVLPGVDGNALLAALDLEGYACSSGSACKTGDPEPSKVLTAVGLTEELALSSLRVTVGRGNSREDIERFTQDLPPIVARLRGEGVASR